MNQDAKDALGIGAIIAGIIAFVLALSVGVWALAVWWAPWKGAGDQRIATVGNASYRIAAYDHFFDLCAQVQATEDQLATANARSVDAGAGFSEGQKDAVLAALRNSRATLIRQYNADASKRYTQAQMLASDLPAKLDPNQENTECAA